MRRHATLALALLLALTAAAAEDGDVPRREPPPSPALLPATSGDGHYTGLSVFAEAHGVWAGDNTADFYSGRPGNANTIERVLHSELYGTQIWTNLRQQGLIASSIGDESQLSVAEYGQMYYRLSYQIGLGLRYDYPSGFGWLLRFDLAQLTANGQFLLNRTANPMVLTGDQYLACAVAGREERINIDLALLRTVQLSPTLDLELDLGVNLNNTKVKDNLIEVGGQTYSILDVWGGQSPYNGVGEYDYINQGGIGYGVLLGAYVGYQIPSVGAIRAGYTLYHTRTTLEGYTSWGWTHLVGVRIEMNNFSFFD